MLVSVFELTLNRISFVIDGYKNQGKIGQNVCYIPSDEVFRVFYVNNFSQIVGRTEAFTQPLVRKLEYSELLFTEGILVVLMFPRKSPRCFRFVWFG